MTTQQPKKTHTYTVVPAQDSEWGDWFVAAIFKGRPTELLEDGEQSNLIILELEDGEDVVAHAVTKCAFLGK